ncbi:cilia- and flagella-associated protein 58 [Rhagoletis pomonella]|uniref:cilia- and flagella-associated protein 58 n=1 Tax=Rhagoletis pomonella TaxID=28610 RepID=UPI00177C21D3|nr:cilia- and flagella-associated protein 58 [Rhagoletis pomonella]
MSAGSRASGSDDEPLVPEDFDDDFYTNLMDKVPEITKALRQKDTHDNADNVQRMVICSNRYKSDWHLEQLRCQELTEEIQRLKERLDHVNKLSKMDQATIAELRTVIEGAWLQKDAAQSREQHAQDEMLKMREKMDTLEQMVEHLSDKRSGLQSKRDEQNERDKLNNEIRELNKRIQIQRLYTSEVEAMTQTLEEKNKALVKMLDETSNEAYNNRKRLDLLEKELAQTRSEEAKAKEKIQQIKSHNDQLIKLKVRHNLQILSLKSNLEHLHTQHNTTSNKLAKTVVELEYAIQERDENKRALTQRISLLKTREDEIIKLKRENAKLVKSEENTARKYATLNDARSKAEEENARLKTQLSTQDKELESMRRIVHQFEKNNEHLTKERDTLKRDLFAEHQTAEQTDEQFQEAQHQIKSLQETISTMEVRQKKLQEDYNKLKKEKTKKVDEIQVLLDKIDALQNEIQLKENYEVELKRAISDLEQKTNNLQRQHDGLLNEKNSVMRNLQTSEEKHGKLEQQISKLQEDIECYKTKVSLRESEMGRLQVQIDKLEKERRLLKTELRYSQLAHQHTRCELLERKKLCDKNTKSLQEDNQKLSQLKRELDHIRDEKNTVSVALTKCNDDYAQLKDQLQTLQTAYEQTERQYAQAQEDMRLMRMEIKNLRTERNVLRKDRENAADLRQELLQMHRLLNQERIKARAMQEEMMTPMNVHRWRNLKGRDPEKMDLIQRIQTLRKQILQQNVTALQHEEALEESQRLYEALKEFMLKLPSHKVRAELNSVKATLSGKERKLKALMAELHVRELDEKSNSQKLDELKVRLTDAKSQLNLEKRQKQKLLEERQLLVQMQAQCFSAPPNMQRTLGASFKLITGA